jgi:hypothetical protein
MFRESSANRQASLFDTRNLMPTRMKERLLASWAATFRQEVFARIPEKVFAPLYSEVDSRPNSPINLLMGAEILKAGFGWTDEEVGEHLEFDLLTRHALGLDDVSAEVPTLRTLYNFRRRVREFAEATGHNLYSDVFVHITDQQLTHLKVKSNWQRLDSTQLLSNIAWMNRLELLIAVLQKGVRGLPADEQQQWQTEQATYLSRPAQNVCYRLKHEEVEAHLLTVGLLLLRLLSQLRASQADEAAIELVERALREPYRIEAVDRVSLRPPEELNGDRLQSPHDVEATYRQKAGESYKGYVTNLSETCDPANPVQLITSVQTATNTTDDSQLLADTLDDLAERQIAIDQATVDGGYNGPTSEAACREHQVHLLSQQIPG